MTALGCASTDSTVASGNLAIAAPTASDEVLAESVVGGATPVPAQTPIPTPTPVPSPTAIPLPPTPTPVPIESRRLLFSGDVLSHTPVIAAALNYGDGAEWPYDYRPMFDMVRDRIAAADLAICVLETPVSVDNTNLTGYPTFNAPRELPDALVDAGYDGCSTASNHSMDRGPTGVATTLDQMDRAGLRHAGMARSETEALAPTIYDLDGLAVAHLSYTYGLNGFVLPADAPWMVNLNNDAAIAAEATRAREAGADIVVLSIQWGNEYQRSPSTAQLELGQIITASSDVDLIIGNHAHVVQPVDTVNEVPVIYGLGNSLSNQYDNPSRTGTQDGVMIEVTVEGNSALGWSVAAVEFAPTWVDRSSYRILDVADELATRSADDALRPVLQESFDRTAEAIGLLGADVALAES